MRLQANSKAVLDLCFTRSRPIGGRGLLAGRALRPQAGSVVYGPNFSGRCNGRHEEGVLLGLSVFPHDLNKLFGRLFLVSAFLVDFLYR